MKASWWLRMLIKAIITPISAVYFLDKFNICDYLLFIPDEHKFDVGLSLYLAVLEMGAEFLENLCSNTVAEIECVFYSDKDNKNINTIPHFVCDSDSDGVTNIYCEVKVKGNIQKLKKCKLIMDIPEWVTSQVPKTNRVVQYSDNRIMWSFNKFLSDSAIADGSGTGTTITFPLINSTKDEIMSEVIRPTLKKPFYCLGVKLRTNGIRIQNRR